MVRAAALFFPTILQQVTCTNQEQQQELHQKQKTITIFKKQRASSFASHYTCLLFFSFFVACQSPSLEELKLEIAHHFFIKTGLQEGITVDDLCRRHNDIIRTYTHTHREHNNTPIDQYKCTPHLPRGKHKT